MFKRLGLSSDRLSDLKSPGETAGLAITAVLLSGYAIGNQRKYGHDALAAIFPDYKTDKPSSHGIWKLVRHPFCKFH